MHTFFFYLVVFAISPNYLFAQQVQIDSDSDQRYVYDLFYKKVSIGKIIRQLRHQDKQITLNTTGELSVLYYQFVGNQLSHLYWDELSHSFLNKNFVRNSIGFSSDSIQAEFSEGGHQASVSLNGETTHYANEKDNIIDFNAVTIQISEGLKLGETHFEFYMQTSDSVEHYFFEVTGKERLATKFGELETYRLQQTKKKDRKLIAWFAPAINYQMVKFIYKRKLLDVRGEISEHAVTKL